MIFYFSRKFLIMLFSNFPFLRYILFFFVGVWIYPDTFFAGQAFWFGVCISCFAVYGILLFLDIRYRYAFYEWALPFLAYLVLVLAAIGFSHLKDVKNDPMHLMHKEKVQGYLGKIIEMDKPRARSVANTVSVIGVKTDKGFEEARAKVLIYHDGSEQLSPGDLVYVPGIPSRIEAPQNPGEFDYRTFMERQQVYYRHFVRDRWYRLEQKADLGFALQVTLFRTALAQKIESHLSDTRSVQIAKAFLLGQKSTMEQEISDAYTAAGAVHILAVSGLHVGIIYGFLFLFWKPQDLSGFKRVFYLLLAVSLIWVYALITGMSPSVMRAATMFSLSVLAQMSSRSPSIYNPLALSAVILIMYDPFIVYSVGFQLSYIALMGILVLQPALAKWWTPKSKVLNYFWQITCVSIAAQLSTFPLTVHYFHTFPTYFLIFNLAVIPGAFLIMAVGIPFLLISFSPMLADVLGQVLDFLIKVYNAIIFSVQYFPYARFDFLYLDKVEIVLIWGLVGSFFWWVQERSRKLCRLFLLALALLVGYQLWEFGKKSQKSEYVVYRLSRGVAMDYFHRGTLYSFEQDVPESEFQFKVMPNRILRGVTKSHPLVGVEVEGGYIVLVPDGVPLYLTPDGEVSQVNIQEGNLLSVPKSAIQDLL